MANLHPVRRPFHLSLPFGMLLMAACTVRSGVDMILTNGTILTMDPFLAPSEAMAIVDGKILAVGWEDEILPLASRKTRRINL